MDAHDHRGRDPSRMGLCSALGLVLGAAFGVVEVSLALAGNEDASVARRAGALLTYAAVGYASLVGAAFLVGLLVARCGRRHGWQTAREGPEALLAGTLFTLLVPAAVVVALGERLESHPATIRIALLGLVVLVAVLSGWFVARRLAARPGKPLARLARRMCPPADLVGARRPGRRRGGVDHPRVAARARRASRAPRGRDGIDLPANAAAVPFVPHDQVLAEAALAVSHAGHGTMCAAARHGVPILAMPLGRDQTTNASVLTDLGIGAALPPTSTPREISESAQRLLDEGTIHQTCDQVASQIAAHDGLHHAVELLTTPPNRRRRKRASDTSRSRCFGSLWEQPSPARDVSPEAKLRKVLAEGEASMQPKGDVSAPCRNSPVQLRTFRQRRNSVRVSPKASPTWAVRDSNLNPAHQPQPGTFRRRRNSVRSSPKKAKLRCNPKAMFRLRRNSTEPAGGRFPVGLAGLEPATSPLSGVRSNQTEL